LGPLLTCYLCLTSQAVQDAFEDVQQFISTLTPGSNSK